MYPRTVQWWRIVSAILPSAFSCAAVSFWFNRFIGITNEGWHYFFGRQILLGKIPYRDFYLFVPPLLPLKNALVISIFGDRVIYMHYLAIAELVVLGIVLTAWLSQIFPIYETSIAVTVSLALYIFAFRGESLSGLHQEAVFFPVLSGFSASVAIQAKRIRYVLLAGLFAGMAFLGKQTSGVATLVCVAALLCMIAWFRHGWKSAFITGLSYGLSALLPPSIVCLWLARHRALQAFFQDVFVKGSSSKGPLGDTLLRPIHMLLHHAYFRLAAILALACVCVLVLFLRTGNLRGEYMSKFLFTFFCALAFLSLPLGVFLSRRIEIASFHPLLQDLPRNFLVFFGLIGCVGLCIRQIFGLLKGCSTERDWQLLFVAGFGSGLGYLVACSWVIYPSVALPCVVVSLACALSAMAFLPALRGLVLAFCALAILQFCIMRLQEPFRWGGWKEPEIWMAQQTVPYPQLAGFRVSTNTAEVLSRITEDIRTNANPSDPVLLYPNIPLFYLLANRSPVTFAYIHYIDVAPDDVDRVDIDKVLRNPPAVIVFWEMTPSELREGETNFRHGRRSGARDFAEALNRLKETYRTIDAIQTGTGDRFVVMTRTPIRPASGVPHRLFECVNSKKEINIEEHLFSGTK